MMLMPGLGRLVGVVLSLPIRWQVPGGFLRCAIKGTPLIEVSEPAIDFTGAFQAVGQAAGLGAGSDADCCA